MKRTLIMRVSLRCLIGMTVWASSIASLNASTTREVNQNDPNAPYQTIGAAVTDSLPGDTVLVHPGTYPEWITVSGIALTAFKGPEVTVIQSPDGTGDGITLTGNQNVTVVGFRVQGFVHGIVVNTSGGATKLGNCVATGNSSDGIQVGVSVPVSAKIQNNISADNGGCGIQASDRGGGLGPSFTSMFNNICYRNGLYGIFYAGMWAAVFGDYNCTYLNSSGDARGILTSPHSITVNPLVDSTKTYRFLSQSSPCVNAGQPASVYSDPDGSPCDMGAYGGPDAANWWRDPFTGPVITKVTIDPPQVRPGSNIVIRATASTQ